MTKPIPETMRAIAIREPGGPEVLYPTQIEVPATAADQVLLRVGAVGLNQADIILRQPETPLPVRGRPQTPGMELAGEIVRVGANVTRFETGQRVCALTPAGGGCAEYCAVPAELCWPLPAGYEYAEAAALPNAVLTIWNCLYDPPMIAPGESILIHGGTSGIGIVAIILARAFGARVFATAGNRDKCEAIKTLGAEQAINYREQDFVEQALAATGGRGLDVILDMVGAPYLDRNVLALAPWGRLVVFGMMGGSDAALNLAPLMAKNVTVRGASLFFCERRLKARKAQTVRERVWPMLDDLPRPIVDAVFPLEETAAAQRKMEQGGHIGKIVVSPLA